MLRWAKLINLPIALAATAVVGYVSIDAHTTATRQEEVLVGLAQQVTELQAAVSKIAQDAKALAAVRNSRPPFRSRRRRINPPDRPRNWRCCGRSCIRCVLGRPSSSRT